MSEPFELSADDNRAWRMAPSAPVFGEPSAETVSMLRPRRIAVARARPAGVEDFAEPQGGWRLAGR
ncbi:MAG: hypothetical protein AB7N54_11530 [Alphaproteobacteria bacterium]